VKRYAKWFAIFLLIGKQKDGTARRKNLEGCSLVSRFLMLYAPTSKSSENEGYAASKNTSFTSSYTITIPAQQHP
jgi:hypothetical protein